MSAFGGSSESRIGSPVTAANVDLSTCDREQIHVPGSIQPHGVLLVIGETDHIVLQVSGNAQRLLGISPGDLLGRSLSEMLYPAQFTDWTDRVLRKRLDANPLYLDPIKLTSSPRTFEGTVHKHDGVLLLQLERRTRFANWRNLDVHASALAMVTALHGAETLELFFTKAAEGVREYTGYDRVVVYRFLEDGSGEVVGESKQEDLPAWLGLRYPASDIPRQARALYLKSWLRIIPDVDAVPALMIPAINPLTGKPLDMSFCILRSVSPIHIQYLKNMGTKASMSLSLIRDDKLWGLIACHSTTPKRISHAARIACEFMAHSVSLQVGAKEAAEHGEYYAELRSRIVTVLETMVSNSTADNFMPGNLTSRQSVKRAAAHQQTFYFEKLASGFRAGGAAFVSDGEVTLLGDTPTATQVLNMLPWLMEQFSGGEVYATDRLPQIYQPATAFAQKASGLLAVQIQRTRSPWLLWFRPEVVRSIRWAGDPNKKIEIDQESGLLRLSPRNSFAAWTEENRGVSEPWWPGETQIAEELQRAVMSVIVRHAEQVQLLHEDLSRINTDLESFAYVASHDLKEPLRGIHNYSHVLMRSLKAKLDESETQRFQMVLHLSQRLDDLIDSLLQYSRVGQTELVTESIPLDEIVNQVLTAMRTKLENTETVVRIPRGLPSVSGDRVRIREVFENLIVNAVKYNNKPERWVEIGSRDGNPTVFYVKDNGIGIDERYHQEVFRIFKRLHKANQYGGGTGAGLTISKRIVERHGGRMWVDSALEEGSTFYFTLSGNQ